MLKTKCVIFGQIKGVLSEKAPSNLPCIVTTVPAEKHIFLCGPHTVKVPGVDVSQRFSGDHRRKIIKSSTHLVHF
jgi:hypothetical protein